MVKEKVGRQKKRPELGASGAEIVGRFRKQFGDDAIAVAALRVEEARQARDPDGVALWNEVARLLMTGPEERPASAGRPHWWLMQRVEFYRHQATKIEREAAAVENSQLGREMTNLAMRWRELALHADLLSKGADDRHRKRPTRRGGRTTRPVRSQGD